MTLRRILIAIGLLFAGAVIALYSQQSSQQLGTQEREKILSAFPKGTIIAWYAKQGAFPHGWAIADGTNGTPDLRGKFLKGVGNMADVGQVFNDATHTHTFSGQTGRPRGGGENGVSDAFKIDDNRGCCPQVTGLDHRHGFSGNTEPGSSIPPNVTVIFLMKVTD